MVKHKDPSNIANDINGFDIIQCKGLQEVQAIIVIPNLGYGFLSTMCARMTKSKGTSTPGASLSHNITPGESSNSKIQTYGKEMFVPSSGINMRMFTTRFNLNDVCSSDNKLSNDMILPLPLKISLGSANNFTAQLETKSYMKNAQEALFRGFLDICSDTDATGSIDATIQTSTASQIIRSLSTSLFGDESNQWTGIADSKDERLETLHLSAISVNDIETIESWDSKYKKTTVPPSPDDIFMRPFVAILANSPDSNKRLYYCEDMTEDLFKMKIRGTSTPSKIICENKMYLLDPDDNANPSPSWGIVIGSDSIESTMGIRHEDYNIIASPHGRLSSVFNSNDIYRPDSLTVWDSIDNQEQTTVAQFYTFRPPVFTSAGILTDGKDERKQYYRLMFSSAYYLPVATVGSGNEKLDLTIINTKEDMYSVMYKDPYGLEDISRTLDTVYNVGDIASYSKKLYKCNTQHTATSTFENEITFWDMIGYHPSSGEIPLREGFGHLAYSVNSFLDIINSTVTLSDLSCFDYDINQEEVNSIIQDLDIHPYRISNGYPATIYSDTVFANIESFYSDVPGGDPDELFMTSVSPGANIVNYSDHKKVWKGESPSDMDSLEILEETISTISNISPALANISDDKIYPYGMRKLAKYIIGPNTPSATVSLNGAKEIPLGGYGGSEPNIVSPIDTPSVASIDSNGIVNIVSLLSSSSNTLGTSDAVVLAKSIVESIPPAVDMIINMVNNIIVTTDVTKSDPILSPAPLFLYEHNTSGEVSSNVISISNMYLKDILPKDNLNIVKNLLSSTDSSILPKALEQVHENFKRGMRLATKIEQDPVGNAGITGLASRLINLSLSQCDTITSRLEQSVIQEQEGTVDYTVFLATDSDGKDTGVAIPREYTSKGLWYYNLRKSYYILRSSINLVRALIEKAYSILAGVSSGYQQAPFVFPEETDGLDISNTGVAFHEIDLSLFEGEDGSKIYPIVNGTDVWPEYMESEGWGEEYGIIDLDTLSNNVELNSIGSYFSPKTLGYDMSISFSGYYEISQESSPVFMMGTGTGNSINILGVSEKIPYVSRENIQPIDGNGNGWQTLSDLSSDDISEKVSLIQDSIGKKDHLKRESDKTVSFINASGEKGNVSYSSLNDLKAQIISGNLSNIVPISGKPPMKGFIDLGYIFPYLSDYSESLVFNLSLNVEFKPNEPQRVENLSSMNEQYLTGDVNYPSFFNCTALTNPSSILSTDSVFKEWNDVLEKLDGVTDNIITRLNYSSWVYELISNPTVPYQISFCGFSDPAAIAGGVGSCMLLNYFEMTEDSYFADELSNSTWSTLGSITTDYNMNINLSKRRAYVVAKYVIGKLLLRSSGIDTSGNLTDIRTKDGEVYRVIVFNGASKYSGASTALTDLASIETTNGTSYYSKYTDGSWEGVYLSRMFKTYGFGDTTGTSTISGDADKSPQRTVSIVMPSPGKNPDPVRIDTSEGNGIYCMLPVGNENSSAITNPMVELSRKSIYYPVTDGDPTRNGNIITIKWKTNPSYQTDSGYLQDVFEYDNVAETYTRVSGTPVSMVSYFFRRVAKYMLGMTDNILADDAVARVAVSSTSKERVISSVESFMSKCFTKAVTNTPDTSQEISQYTNYGKAFYAHNTCLDNVWLLVVKKK